MRTQKGRGYIARADFEFTRERWFVLKIPDDAGCTQGGKKVGSKRETMAGRHAQKDKERQQRHPVGAQCKERIRLMMMMLRGGHQEVRGVTVSRAGERVPPYTVNELP